MSNLFIVNETFTNGYRVEILDIISVLAILSGIIVIISKNPIVSVLFLILLFLNIAIYLMILGLNYIGLSYLLVYIGAVSILFLFILMLINIRISEILSNTSNSIPLAIFIIISFSYPLDKILPYSIPSLSNYTLNVGNMLQNIFYNINGNLNNLFNTNDAIIDNGEIYFVTSKL
jgi:NADH-ubiquinone oxidoreductase chain 6